MLDRLREDARTAVERDPAATRPVEVLLYPGVLALWTHRVASAVHARGHPVLARLLAQVATLVTGVDLHPAASVGRRVFVDHGTGVVVGETARVGDDVLLHQGVTLGARDGSVDAGRRHPAVEDGAALGANATVLGPVTVGEGAAVGAGAVVLENVPPGATVVGVPAERVDDAESDATATGDLRPDDGAGRVDGIHG